MRSIKPYSLFAGFLALFIIFSCSCNSNPPTPDESKLITQVRDFLARLNLKGHGLNWNQRYKFSEYFSVETVEIGPSIFVSVPIDQYGHEFTTVLETECRIKAKVLKSYHNNANLTEVYGNVIGERGKKAGSLTAFIIKWRMQKYKGQWVQHVSTLSQFQAGYGR